MYRLLCLFLLLLIGCQQSVPTHQNIRINIGCDPQTLDPRKARDLNTITLMHMLFEGLTRTSRSGETELALAQSVDLSEELTQYTFHLRDACWSNGDAVTSFDFARSWRSTLDPSFPTDVAYQLYVIKNGQKAKKGELNGDQLGIRTPDAHTLVVELEQPIPYFFELISMPSFFPIHSESHVGNGPFSLQTWTHSDLIQIAKNPRYWQADAVQIEGMDLFMVAGDTEIRMFEEGKLDWAGSPLSTIPTDAIADLRAHDELQISPFSGTYFFRTNIASNPLSSVSFRKALALALNREEITQHILQGGQKPARSLVPPEMGLSEEGYLGDAGQAQAFLKEALAELGHFEPITISYKSDERNAALAQAVQKQWEKELGIQVRLEAIEPKVFYRRVSHKEYQIAASSWTADFNDPINFLEVFKYKDASTNNTNWENSKYIDLLTRSGLCRDSKERKRLLREAEAILMDQMPMIPLFHYALNYLQSDGLEEVVLSPVGNIDFRWAHWVDKPL